MRLADIVGAFVPVTDVCAIIAGYVNEFTGQQVDSVRRSIEGKCVVATAQGFLLTSGTDIILAQIKDEVVTMKTLFKCITKVAVLTCVGDKIAFSYRYSVTINVWDQVHDILLLVGHASEVTHMAALTNGSLVSLGENVRSWDVETGEKLFTVQCRASNLTALQNGMYAVNWLNRGTIAILQNYRRVCTIDQEHGASTIEKFAPFGDGLVAVMYSAEKTVDMWNCETGQFAMRLKFDGNVVAIEALSCGMLLVAHKTSRRMTKLLFFTAEVSLFQPAKEIEIEYDVVGATALANGHIVFKNWYSTFHVFR